MNTNETNAIPMTETVRGALSIWASSPDRAAVASAAGHLLACLRSEPFDFSGLDTLPERDQSLVADIFTEWMTVGLSEDDRRHLIDVFSMLESNVSPS